MGAVIGIAMGSIGGAAVVIIFVVALIRKAKSEGRC